ncbi:MAG: hypothetical protein ABF586_03795 [Sporolactobacillus sp.]
MKQLLYAFYREAAHGLPLTYSSQNPDACLHASSVYQAAKLFADKYRYHLGEVEELMDKSARAYMSEKGWFKDKNEDIYLIVPKEG